MLPMSESRVCSCCKDDRLNATPPKPMRTLVRLATKSQKGRDVFACEHCDGPVVENSTRHAQKVKRLRDGRKPGDN